MVILIADFDLSVSTGYYLFHIFTTTPLLFFLLLILPQWISFSRAVETLFSTKTRSPARRDSR